MTGSRNSAIQKRLNYLIEQGQAIKIEAAVEPSMNKFLSQVGGKELWRVDVRAFQEWVTEVVGFLETVVPVTSLNYSKVMEIARSVPSKQSIEAGVAFLGGLGKALKNPVTPAARFPPLVDLSNDVRWSIVCNRCGGPRDHRLMKQDVRNDSEKIEGGRDVIEWKHTRQMLECCGCHSVTLRLLEWFSEVPDVEGETLWPPRVKFLRVCDDRYAPPPIPEILRQTCLAFDSGLNLLAAAGIRTALESICMSLKINGGKVPDPNKPGQEKTSKMLDGKINGLAEAKHLTFAQAEMLHSHRFLGNDAVHGAVIPTDEEIHACLDILFAVIDQVWKHPEESKKIRAARAARKSAKP
ncbi:MAG: DUF4145 domain-containing protein [Candidatus Riflebacteria bacterium]|nr:DUF4145 domain-containing protein [Candidatus Riflebacteria bacterium]